MKKSLLACAVLGIAASAQAAVVLTPISKGTPFNSSVTANGYTGWVLRLASDTGNISGVDVSGSRGIIAPMVQRWNDPDSPDGTGNWTGKTVTAVNQNASANNANFDSHFLPPNGDVGNMLVGSALTEDAAFGAVGQQFGGVFPANTVNSAIGQGSFLKGAYGVAAAAQSPTLDVAYIVLANQYEINGAGAVRFTGEAQVSTANGTFVVPIKVTEVPEPATLSLAGLALGLVARRRH